MTIKLSDLTIEELINLYSYLKKGRTNKDISLNEYECLRMMILNEIEHRHTEECECLQN